jgi:electron transport complex protein RnfC
VRRLHDFHGGIFPPERKSLSSDGAIVAAGIPPQVVLPLSQHIGPVAEAVVAVGDRVLGGQPLTDAQGLPVHAPTSGTVAALEERSVPHPSGLPAPCIVIDCDGEDEWLPLQGCEDFRALSHDELRQRIFAAGIAGLGGAGFPTAYKLGGDAGRGIHTLILNGTECEPYITADDRLMRERAAAVIGGARILAHLVQPDEILIGVEDNKPEAVAALRAALGDHGDIDVVEFPTKYPSGGERQLIQILTGKQVPSGGLPADIGILCQNVGTAAAVHAAVTDGRPLVSRITTVTGEAVQRPGNFEVLVGTPMAYLLERAGFAPGPRQRLLMGGPMMGIAVPSVDCPVVKTTNCLLAPAPGELREPPAVAQPCIRCGLCAEACPAQLLPQQLYWYSRAEDHEQLDTHNLFDCIECGACSWVCPSSIPLVQFYRASKGAIRERQAAEARSEHARLRFEARQARKEREAAEKEARRAARKKAALAKAAQKPAAQADATAGDNAAAGEDPIQAAIARAKARRARQGETSGDAADASQVPTGRDPG